MIGDIEELARAITMDAEEQGLPIVLLGDDGTWSSALRDWGARFLMVDVIEPSAKAMYILAADLYGSYRFPRGSVVIDIPGTLPEAPGVRIERFTHPVPELDFGDVDITPEDKRRLENLVAGLVNE